MKQLTIIGIGLLLIGLAGCEKKTIEQEEVSIRSREQFVTTTPEQQEDLVEVTIGIVGDVMLGRSVNTRMMKYQDNEWPFRKVAEKLKVFDLTLGNLENPLIEGCKPMDEGMIFCGRPEAVRGLVSAGFDGMSLANNHALNYGVEGRQETEEILELAAIQPIGNGRVGQYEIQGIRVGVLSYDDVTSQIKEDEVIQDIRELRKEVEMVIIMPHWGVEYRSEPTERQKQLGREWIDTGADVVAGSHPHWTQPVEYYKEGVIFYSLGNFVFDQMWSEKTREGEVGVIRAKFTGQTLTSIEVELLPVMIEDYGQPRIIDDGL